MICPNCQFQNPEGAFVCQQCKTVLSVPPPTPDSPTVVTPVSGPSGSDKLWFQQWWVILLMAIALGPLGLIVIAVLHGQKNIRLPKIFWALLVITILPLIVIIIAFTSVKNISQFSSAWPSLPAATPATNQRSPAAQTVVTADSDNDGVPDDIEVKIGTNPNYQECSEFLTNPCGLITASVGAGTTKNVLIILDASGSMAEKISAKSKMDIAKDVLADYLKTLIDKQFKVGLMVYGHRGSNSAQDKSLSCAGIDTVLPIGSGQTEIAAALESFSPTGWTPIAGSLNLAKDVLSEFTGQDNYVLLVSDGEETCGGDPLAAAANLKQSDVKAVVDVIGLNVDAKTKSQLESVAAAAGGKFIFSADEAGFRRAAAEIQAGILTAKSGLNAQICVAQEKHRLLTCLTDFYYTRAQSQTTGLKEKNLLTEKYREMEKKFNDLTAPFIQRSREAIQEGAEQIETGRSGKY